MTVPVISVFKNSYPNTKITILTTKFFSELFNQIPDINFLFFKENHKTIFGLFLLKREIIKLEVDCIIDLHNVLRTNIIKFLLNSNIPFLRVNKGRNEKKKVLNTGKLKKLKSMHQRYSDVFSDLKLNLDLEKFTPYKKVDISNSNYNFIKTQKLVGIAPFAKHDSKEYSFENILKIIDNLSSSASIVLFGAKGEEERRLKYIAEERQNTFSVAGKLSLKDEMAVISNLDIMISMDSANGHIASIFGVNVISLWGATHPYLGYSPFGQPEENSIIADINKYPKIPVSIYGKNCPKEYINAINSIEVKDILKRINEII